MAKNVLPVDFQDDILAESMNGRRKYQMITNSDGTVSFVDVTEYKQVGSNFGQAQVNATNEAVNESADKNKIIDDKDDLVANSQAGMMAGALAVKAIREELNQNMSLLEALWTPNTNFSGSAHKIGKKRMIYVETGWLPWTSEKQVAGWTSDIPAVIDSKYAIMMSGSGAPIGICNVDIGDDTVISITPPTDWVSGTSAHIRAWISYYIE